MKHLKKFEELEYTSTEKRDYQSKVDSIINNFLSPIEFMKFDKSVKDQPRVKVNVDITDSEESTLTINFGECSVRIFTGDKGRVISIYKPGNGYVLTRNTIEDLFKLVNRVSNYLGLSESSLDKIYKILSRFINNENHINQDFSI
jgi:hypothetical protein